jgi:hypothetical protein
MRAVVVLVVALVLVGVASAAQSPGQWLSNYIAQHAKTYDDREAFVGAAIQGGHTAVVNGQAVVRHANFEIITSYGRRTVATRNSGIRLCVVAAQGLSTRPALAAEVGDLWVLAKQKTNGVSAVLAELTGTGRCVASTIYVATNFR